METFLVVHSFYEKVKLLPKRDISEKLLCILFYSKVSLLNADLYLCTLSPALAATSAVSQMFYFCYFLGNEVPFYLILQGLPGSC